MAKPVVSSKPLNGTFQGKYLQKNTIEQFLGIQYASIEKRWELPTLLQDYQGSVLDVSEQGPICPQDTPYKDSLIGIPPNKVIDFKLEFDEFNCLSLVITRPAGTNKSSGLPVICWIHGGGNMAGTPYRTLCDFQNFVHYSREIGKPCIGVGIQYRVGMLGFLPYNGIGNFALHDQRMALQWISRNIGEFGGNTSNITLMGQSSGSWCVITQSVANGLSKNGRYFQRAACFAGSTASIPVVSLDEYTERSVKIAELCGTDLEGLRSIPWQTLVKASQHDIGMTVAFPVDDGKFLPAEKFGTAPIGLDSCLISDCREDAYFWLEYMEDPKKMAELIRKSPGGDKLATSYKIDGTSGIPIVDFLTDCIFCAANEKLDSEMRRDGKALIYRLFFDITNPHTASFGNNHMVDVICLFDMYKVQDTEKQLMIHKLQRKMIQFAYGEAPWDNNKVLLVDDTGYKQVEFNTRDTYRRLHLFDQLVGFEKTHDKMFHQLTFTGW